MLFIFTVSTRLKLAILKGQSILFDGCLFHIEHLKIHIEVMGLIEQKHCNTEHTFALTFNYYIAHHIMSTHVMFACFPCCTCALSKNWFTHVYSYVLSKELLDNMNSPT